MQETLLPSGAFAFLDELAPQNRARLVEASIRLEPAEGDTLLRPGDPAGGAVLVMSGSVRVYFVAKDGRQGTLYWIDPGETCVLALNSAMSDAPYPAYAEATEDSCIAIVPAPILRELAQSEPALLRFLFGGLNTQLFDLMRLVEETVSHGLEQRVAAFLLRRARAGALDMTHEEIAANVASSREVVSRVLRRLATMGAVRLGHGSLTIVDADRLSALAD